MGCRRVSDHAQPQLVPVRVPPARGIETEEVCMSRKGRVFLEVIGNLMVESGIDGNGHAQSTISFTVSYNFSNIDSLREYIEKRPLVVRINTLQVVLSASGGAKT
jgi:hypothetical protein